MTSGRVHPRLLRGALASLLVLPWLPPLLSDMPALAAATAPLDAWFSLHCHRDPNRSLAALAVCVRCYGIYFGLGSGALFCRPRLAPFAYRVWVVTAALIVVLDVLTETLGMRPASAVLRFVSGALLGYPVGSALVLALERPALTTRQ